MARIGERQGRLTNDPFGLLLEKGLPPEKVEILDGRVLCGLAVEDGYDDFSSPQGRARGGQLGVSVYSCMEAVLVDRDARMEVFRRIRQEHPDEYERARITADDDQRT